jgi:hypothetical protein
MTLAEIRICQIRIRAVDALILSALLAFSILDVLFLSAKPGGWILLGKNVIVAIAYLSSLWMVERTVNPHVRVLLRVCLVTLAYGYLFLAVDKLQLIVHGRWLDQYVLDAEAAVFGVQPTIWLQKFTRPVVTEWMMFSYMAYFPLYPIICAIIFHFHGEAAVEDYFFSLGLTNFLCDIGFILFPIAGPVAALGTLYHVPLQGYWFTYLGEWVRTKLQFVGGSVPSPHCAAATIMWAMAWRYHRPTFYLLTPVMLSLYISTFYGRYHYVTDAVTGVGVALLALLLAPALTKAWNRLAARFTRPNEGGSDPAAAGTAQSSFSKMR